MKAMRTSAGRIAIASLVLVTAGVTVVAYLSQVGPDHTGVWTNPGGLPADRGEGMDARYELRVFQGPDHCGWQRATFMSVVWPPGTTARLGEPADTPLRQYVRDPEGVLGEPELRRGFDISRELPADAVDTGFRRGDARLWLGPDRGEEFLYVASDDHVERWPRNETPAGCA